MHKQVQNAASIAPCTYSPESAGTAQQAAPVAGVLPGRLLLAESLQGHDRHRAGHDYPGVRMPAGSMRVSEKQPWERSRRGSRRMPQCHTGWKAARQVLPEASKPVVHGSLAERTAGRLRPQLPAHLGWRLLFRPTNTAHSTTRQAIVAYLQRHSQQPWLWQGPGVLRWHSSESERRCVYGSAQGRCWHAACHILPCAPIPEPYL